MPRTKVTVPPEDREVVLRDLLTLYGVKAESIFTATNEYLGDTSSLAALLDQRMSRSPWNFVTAVPV